MPKKYTEEEYYNKLSKKISGSAVLFFNSQGELLIVKPDYKEGWLVPGGSIEEGESPLQCAIRETNEEIGLDISNLKLVGVYHSAAKEFSYDAIKFVFYGGILTNEQISQIQLQTSELEEYAFKSPDEAVPLLSPSLQKCLPECIKIIKEKSFGKIFLN